MTVGMTRRINNLEAAIDATREEKVRRAKDRLKQLSLARPDEKYMLAWGVVPETVDQDALARIVVIYLAELTPGERALLGVDSVSLCTGLAGEVRRGEATIPEGAELPDGELTLAQLVAWYPEWGTMFANYDDWPGREGEQMRARLEGG
jgi:hypothetical protein